MSTTVPAVSNDAFELNQLVNSAFRGESSKQGWTTEADILGGQRTDVEKIKEFIAAKNTVILKMLEDSKIIGCVLLEKRGSDCYLGMLTINPKLQAKGLGKKLLKNSESFAKSKWKCSTISMTVITSRTELRDWYLRHGYKMTGEKKPFPMNDERFGIPKVSHIEFDVLSKEI